MQLIDSHESNRILTAKNYPRKQKWAGCFAGIRTLSLGREYVWLPTFMLFLLVEVALQWAGGAFSSEFGGHPDEAAHYVTTLMLRDYLVAPGTPSPMRFAEDYYLHYPKVALGHWPPFFYLAQAIWTLLFSPSRLSMLLLMALLTSLLATIVYVIIRREVGSKAGAVVGLLLLAQPLIQRYSSMVMLEILLALLCFLAALRFGQFLDNGKWRDAIGFSIWSTLAILTKGNGLTLAMLPPIAMLFSRRFHLLARLSFWCPAMLVLVFCGPWYWLTLDMVRNAWQAEAPTLGFAIEAIRYYSYHLVKIIGIGPSFLVLIGFVVSVARPWSEKRVEGRWAAVGALLVSVLMFHVVVPSSQEERYLITAVPALLMFLTAGIAWTADRLPLRRLATDRKVVGMTLAVMLVIGVQTFAIPKKAWHGFGDVAEQLLSTADFQSSVFLVASDPQGEGMFISEVAMRERRPGHVVLRASKILSRSRWNGETYELLYNTPEEIMSYLEGIPVGVVVLDVSIPIENQTADFHLLQETLNAFTQQWAPVGSYPLTRLGTTYAGALQIYRLLGHENRPMGTIRLDMRPMLNKTIEK
jgi:hypothetical protein